MKPAHLAELLLLAALWGASFLFIRMGAHEFGPLALAALRVSGASLLLVPTLALRGEWPALRRHWRPIALVGLTNSGIPFVCYGVAALAITGGLSSVFNATTPLWGALIGWWWLKDRPDASRTAGLALGFIGVLWLAGGSASFKPGDHGVSPAVAVACCLFATLNYGFSANFTKRHLQGIPAMALATGSQLGAAVLLVPLALVFPPAAMPSPSAWAAVAGLAFLCTGVAYILYFRLIAHVGATHAMSVTFLIPAFAVLWGSLFLGETVSATMVAACLVILVGTGLVTGLIRLHKPAAAAPRS